MSPARAISYAQRFEDLHLARCFGDKTDGFYIDVGSGHPVVDNVSFRFYLHGWRGILVEPNPDLARLTRAVRPRDIVAEELAGAAPGEATFFLVDEFHGLSTMIEGHARSADEEFGKKSKPLTRPVTTLRHLCEAHAPQAIDFLKIDVEGAEKDVLLGGDWTRFRPRVVVIEALAPYTMTPAWADWEPILQKNDYGFVWFDTLNRYYVANEARQLADCFEGAPNDYPGVRQIGLLRPALEDDAHPDRRLAELLARAAMIRLPLLEARHLLDFLTLDFAPAQLDRPATQSDAEAAYHRLFETEPPPDWAASLDLPAEASIRDLYARLIETDRFRTALGRIAATYSW